MTSTLRRRLCTIVALALMWTQLALAAYACALDGPGMPGIDGAARVPCEEMRAGRAAVDADDPALCFEHCRADSGQQPAQATPASDAFVPTLELLFVLPPSVEVAGTGGEWTSQRRPRDRPPPEPHSIVHCCWRI